MNVIQVGGKLLLVMQQSQLEVLWQVPLFEWNPPLVQTGILFGQLDTQVIWGTKYLWTRRQKSRSDTDQSYTRCPL